jgi:tetratricopeptide (TPR) repeat protein
MQTSEFLPEFQRIFDPENASRVLYALRRDPLLWAGVQQDETFQRMKALAADNPDLWSPANLALNIFQKQDLAADQSLAGKTISAIDLAGDSMPAIGKSLRQRAIQSYEEMMKKIRLPGTLEEAGLLALALRERRRQMRSWDGFADELLQGNGVQPASGLMVWATPLACLYGMIPDPIDMLKNVLKGKDPERQHSLVDHVLFSNPLTFENRVEQYHTLFVGLSNTEQSLWLQSLVVAGETRLTTELSNKILHTTTQAKTIASSVVSTDMNAEAIAKMAVDLESQSAIERLSGEYQLALDRLKIAKKALQQWLADVNLQIAWLASQDGNIDASEQAIDEAFDGNVEIGGLHSEFALSLGDDLKGENLIRRISQSDEDDLNPFMMIEQARWMASSGDTQGKKETAQKAVNKLMSAPNRLQWIAPKHVLDWKPSRYVHSLLDLELLSEALQLNMLLLKYRPVDTELLDLGCEILLKMNELDQAINYARIGTVLEPADMTWHRRLADILERKDNWQDSFQERDQVLQLPGSIDLEDWVAYVQSAVRCGYLQKAINVTSELLEKYPNDGRLNALMGEAQLALGDHREAAMYLGRAILLSPEQAETWLMLADSYQKMGEQQRALESLRAAVLAVPNSPDLNFRLAQECLNGNLPSEALPFLRRAAELIPNSYEVAYQLGCTLHALGYLSEAVNVLAKARQKWVQDADLAYEHGKVMLELGETEAAIPALEIAMLKNPPEFDRYLLYAKTLLGDWRQYCSFRYKPDFARLVNAQQALEKALAIVPDDFMAHLLTAEILAVKGDNEKAYEVYQSLVETPEGRSKEWQLRVRGGFGKVALATGNVDTALAALQDATSDQPDEFYFLRLMAEAYKAAQLEQEALQAARQAHKLTPDDLDMLSWFASFALSLGAENEAIESLQCATQLDPDHAEYWLRLANLQLQVGNREATRTALNALLNLEGLTALQYRQAAYAFLRMEETGPAMKCLQEAVKVSDAPAPDLLFELAQLLAQSDQLDDALIVLQNAIDHSPENVNLHVFQSDLMGMLNRPQAAMACLEHALRIKMETNVSVPATNTAKSCWWDSLSDLAGIEARFGKLMHQSGDLSAAVQHFERALNLYPNDIGFRMVVTSLYQDLMLDEPTRKWARFPETISVETLVENEAGLTGDEYDALVNFTCLIAELKLHDGDSAGAAQAILPVLPIAKQHPRVLAIQSRLAAQSGSLKSATDLYRAAMHGYEDLVKGEGGSKKPGKPVPYSIRGEYEASQLVSLADAALDAQCWSEAIELSEMAVEKNSHALRPFVELAKKLVLRAERERLCKFLKVDRNAPGIEAIGESAYADFQSALTRAASMGHGDEMQRWRVRGEAAFHPTAQNIRVLASYSRKTDDTAALILALREANNVAAAIQIAGEAPDVADVMIQTALCYLDSNPQRGLEIAQVALLQLPSDPLRHAIVAQLADRAEKWDIALEAVENAVEIWPDEAGWHAWAARLAEKTGANRQAIRHLEIAIHLKPAETDYALSLGRLHMQNGDAYRVVEILNKPDHLGAGNPEIWFVLAKAYRQLDRAEDAIACAEKASELDKTSAEPLLLCGEVALKRSDIESASTYANLALERDPKSADIVLFLARVYLYQSKKEEALNLIEFSLPTRETSVELLFERAQLVYELRGARPALNLLREVCQSDTDNAVAYSLLAQAEAECGDLEPARADLHRALRLKPDQPELTFLMGRLQKESGQLDQTIHYYSETIRLDPTCIDAYLELAQTYQERREYQQALKTYQQASKIIPNDYRPYYASGLIFRENKDYTGAEDMLRKAAKLAPDDINIRRQLGAMIALNLVHNSQEANTSR